MENMWTHSIDLLSEACKIAEIKEEELVGMESKFDLSPPTNDNMHSCWVLGVDESHHYFNVVRINYIGPVYESI